MLLTINMEYLADYFLNVDMPQDIKLLVLEFSNHIRCGRRTMSWVCY
jgi:hypothetical protein